MNSENAFGAKGESARLIPVVADTSREVRAASVLLATMFAVPPFAKVMLGSLDQRLGSRSSLQCFTEVTLPVAVDGAKMRPDGLIIIESGKGNVWACLVEAKIGNADVDAEQVQKYVSLARANNIPAILTISNQFVATARHSPVPKPKGKTEVFHWSWMHVVTEASLLLSQKDFESVEQEYLLQEMLRYFMHDSVGVSTFDKMNPEWKDLVQKVQAGTQLSRSSPEVENSVAAWHEESRDSCFMMSLRLGRPVSLKLSRAHSDDPDQRLKDDCDGLAKNCELSFEMEIPDAAAPIRVSANLLRRNIAVSMSLSAPKDKVRAASRISWIVKQLQKTSGEGVYVRALWPGKSADTMCSLLDLRANPASLESANKSLAPHTFEVFLIRDLGAKFSGAKTFLEQIAEIIPQFYEDVGQHLRVYTAAPPRMSSADQPTVLEEISEADIKKDIPLPAPSSGELDASQSVVETSSSEVQQ
jgi:hypothetical protein